VDEVDIPSLLEHKTSLLTVLGIVIAYGFRWVFFTADMRRRAAAETQERESRARLIRVQADQAERAYRERRSTSERAELELDEQAQSDEERLAYLEGKRTCQEQIDELRRQLGKVTATLKMGLQQGRARDQEVARLRQHVIECEEQNASLFSRLRTAVSRAEVEKQRADEAEARVVVLEKTDHEGKQ